MIAWARRPMQIWIYPCRAHRRTNIFCYRLRAKPNARGDDWYSTALAVPVSTRPSFLRKVPSLRRNSSSSGLAAARIVLAGGLEGEARVIENTGQPGTRLANGAEFRRRAVRDAAPEYQRLLEASELELVPAAEAL